ncbi:hypothetical protein [Nonlabens ulvanivorans]|uniref:hypothetical protein n=1 Tax=Nonlabens ulvanivorans TaxID=906888 RepID=UPI0029432BE7|nr:hypothetical protein [Nonlabens ulvanivorans]WOI23756.1 hypothetical protein R1T42_04700 [Nonlabens ulvanivorans]
MKKITLFVTIIILSISCSSSNITASQWMSDDFKNESIDIMLIYANTEDQDLQKDFENETADMLTQKGITSYKMHEVFPDVTYKEVRTQQEINTFIKDCQEKNISKILFASQKSVSIDTVATKSLHNYMNSLQPLNIDGPDQKNIEYDTEEVTTYIIEAAVYDIDKTKEDKPIATTTVTASNVKSLDQIKERLLKEITILFKNKS